MNNKQYKMHRMYIKKTGFS